MGYCYIVTKCINLDDHKTPSTCERGEQVNGFWYPFVSYWSIAWSFDQTHLRNFIMSRSSNILSCFYFSFQESASADSGLLQYAIDGRKENMKERTDFMIFKGQGLPWTCAEKLSEIEISGTTFSFIACIMETSAASPTKDPVQSPAAEVGTSTMTPSNGACP